jgi:uncharacterized protein involved in outer membrane biogenesis
MKTFFRWLFRLCVALLVLVIVLAAVAVILKDPIAKSLTEYRLRHDTGLDAKISKMEIGLATPIVNVEGLKLYNTDDFGGSTFLEMPELRVEYVPEAMRAGKVRFKTVRLNLAEVHIVKGKDGKTNLEMMQKHSKKKSEEKSSGGGLPGVEFGGVDALYLTVGKIRITDEKDPRNNDVIEVGLKDEAGRNLKTEAEVTMWFTGVLFKVAAREMYNPKTGEERRKKIQRLFGWKF